MTMVMIVIRIVKRDDGENNGVHVVVFITDTTDNANADTS